MIIAVKKPRTTCKSNGHGTASCKATTCKLNDYLGAITAYTTCKSSDHGAVSCKATTCKFNDYLGAITAYATCNLKDYLVEYLSFLTYL